MKAIECPFCGSTIYEDNGYYVCYLCRRRFKVVEDYNYFNKRRMNANPNAHRYKKTFC